MFVSTENSTLISCSISARLNLMPERLVCADDFDCNTFLQVKYDCSSALTDFYTVLCNNTVSHGFTVSLTVKPVLSFDQTFMDSQLCITLTNLSPDQKKTEKLHEPKPLKGFVRRTSSRFRDLSCGMLSRRCASFRL